jgi:hypothetical protein
LRYGFGAPPPGGVFALSEERYSIHFALSGIGEARTDAERRRRENKNTNIENPIEVITAAP